MVYHGQIVGDAQLSSILRRQHSQSLLDCSLWITHSWITKSQNSSLWFISLSSSWEVYINSLYASFPPSLSQLTTPSLLTFPCHFILTQYSNLLLPSATMSGMVPRHGIAPRSQNPPTQLSEPCCLRCSKSLFRFFGQERMRCVKIGNRSVCERCRSMNKKCYPVGLLPWSFG